MYDMIYHIDLISTNRLAELRCLLLHVEMVYTDYLTR